MRHASSITPLFASVLFAFSASPTLAENEIRTEQVHFKRGANSATIEGKIRGYETVDYVLEAGKGQHMNVSMATDNAASYFNILAPGENEAAMFIGSTSGNQFDGTLPESGDYKIRIYMMRSAARRNETAKYRLEMIIIGAVAKASTAAPKNDAVVKGTDFHATGNIPCATAVSQPTASCPFGVKRDAKGRQPLQSQSRTAIPARSSLSTVRLLAQMSVKPTQATSKPRSKGISASSISARSGMRFLTL